MHHSNAEVDLYFDRRQTEKFVNPIFSEVNIFCVKISPDNSPS